MAEPTKLTIYDIYPYSEEPLSEFTSVQQLPDQADMSGFADSVSTFLEARENPQYLSGPDREDEAERSELWFPEGMITATKFILRVGRLIIPREVEVMVSANKEVNDATISHSYIVSLAYSKEQMLQLTLATKQGDPAPRTSFHYRELPILTDLGIDDLSDTDTDGLGAILHLRSDEPPNRLEMRPGTLTEDPATAEIQSKAEELTRELALSGEIVNFFEPGLISRIESAPETACSQRTLRAVTALLRQYTA